MVAFFLWRRTKWTLNLVQEHLGSCVFFLFPYGRVAS
uniref:Uncharacterized protein n=1 Tax=Rhizophora mucronata TaxID=61149 RepID=A0A2P2MI03_RHIMU